MKTYKMDDGFKAGYCALDKTGQRPEFDYDSDTEWVRAEDAKEMLGVLQNCEDYFDGCKVMGVEDPDECAVLCAEGVRRIIAKHKQTSEID